ncbi:MAG: hypothetical protein JO048_16855 [Methylobacteriaceae bacterium]|nr:hypothetical protein [Methylobacteriaceae bacterium]
MTRSDGIISARRAFALAALSITLLLAWAPRSGSAQEIKGQAESWGLQNESLAVISGKVVDIVCELSGDCPSGCGQGLRQLGIVTSAGKLIPVSKNGQPAFTGAIQELFPFCQKTVDLDGLYAGDTKNRLFQVQLIRETGAQSWIKAERWTQEWAKQNPSLAGSADEWYFQDPRIAAQIKARGYLGLGPGADRDAIRDAY